MSVGKDRYFGKAEKNDNALCEEGILYVKSLNPSSLVLPFNGARWVKSPQTVFFFHSVCCFCSFPPYIHLNHVQCLVTVLNGNNIDFLHVHTEGYSFSYKSVNFCDLKNRPANFCVKFFSPQLLANRNVIFPSPFSE